jgi:hypothetical protein
MELLRFFVWATRLIGGIVVLRFTYKAYKVVDAYDSGVFLAQSAVQASQLSGEQLLVAASSIGILIATGIVMVAMELVYLSALMDRTRAVEAPPVNANISELQSNTDQE